jgi:hypothetical protein
MNISERWDRLRSKTATKYGLRTIDDPPVKPDPLAGLPGYRQITSAELVSNFEIIEANGDLILVTDANTEVESAQPTVSLADPVHYPEIGSTGQSNWASFMREEYNAELREHLGLRKYDRMRRSDASVRSALRLFKTPILSARWFVQPATESPQDVEIAEFIADNLFKRMSISWPQVLWEALLMLDFGYYMFEKVYVERDGLMYWQKFAPRHPLDCSGWTWDAHGGPVGATFHSGDGFDSVFIPIEKLAVFTFDREAGDIRGLSALRSAYKHWYFKENLYKIDAIQKERHGVGVPIIKLPPGYSATDRNVAHELGRNLRSNEKAHVVLPPFWEVMFAKLEGQHVDALESAEHHSKMIFQNILGEFMVEKGSSSGESQMELFLKSTRYIAEIIRDVFNKYCIPQLVDMNWDVDDYPELRVRRIGDTQDWRMISFALRNLIGANVIKPDEKLDAWARDEMDLPRADPSTVRETDSPQAPGARVGLPRQSQAGNMRIQPGQQAGRDRSGQSGTGTN